MGSDITSWDKQVENYRKYFSILVFDNLGSGKSDEPRSGHSMEIFASNTLEILDHLKIRKTHMIGKSMGGMIAQVFAGKYKKRVDKLVLGCTTATRDNIGKEIINIQTVCIDGYKFIITSNSIEQFYEESDGLPMPAPCYSR